MLCHAATILTCCEQVRWPKRNAWKRFYFESCWRCNVGSLLHLEAVGIFPWNPRRGGWPSEIAAARNLCLDRGTADGRMEWTDSCFPGFQPFCFFQTGFFILCHWICQATLVSWEWYVNPHVLGWWHVTAQWGYQHRSIRFVECFRLPRLRSAKVASPISTPARVTTAHASRKWTTTGNSTCMLWPFCGRSLAAALITRC